ncbi:MAG: hypothetical protein WCE63_23210 [Acidobacteriaceae bacterium]
MPILVRWVICGAIIIGAIVFVTYKEHGVAQKYQRECQANSAAVTVSPEQKTGSADKCQDPANYLPWWYVLVAWPEGITTWAILATLIVIGWQSWETRRAANATADSANAANGSVVWAKAQLELMIEKERARLEVGSGAQLKIDTFLIDLWSIDSTVTLRNIGANRAFDIRLAGVLVVADEEGNPLGGLDQPNFLDLSDRLLDPDTPPKVTLPSECVSLSQLV